MTHPGKAYRRIRTKLITRSERSFDSFYFQSRFLRAPNLKITDSALVREVCNNFNRHGLSVFPQMHSAPDVLDSISNFAETCWLKWEEMHTQLKPGEWSIPDETGNFSYQYSTLTRDPTVFGRKRVFFQDDDGSTGIPCIDSIYRDPRLSLIVEAYFGITPIKRGALLELLTPSIEGDSWHVDTVRDQCKAMILISDTTSDNGPMQYKLNSHNATSREHRRVLYQMYKFGLDYAYPSNSIVAKLPGDRKLATGQKGDCVFFDTLGIHSGTRCHLDSRLALVVYFDIPSYKNRTLRQFASQTAY